MTENTRDNPYDTLFRAAFGVAKTALELTLLLLQFTQTSGRSAYVYVLYEHKSTPDRWVTLQLLRYMATLWYRLQAKSQIHTAGRLPEILPIVLYHGKEPWSGPIEFAELITGGEDTDDSDPLPSFSEDWRPVPSRQAAPRTRSRSQVRLRARVLHGVSVEVARVEAERVHRHIYSMLHQFAKLTAGAGTTTPSRKYRSVPMWKTWSPTHGSRNRLPVVRPYRMR